jgi:UDP-2,4-diacetamido-2,4,6-trideoxy-beta-L-altropyranose hydrolase
MTAKVIFRCDAGSKPEIGSGHIVRSINLANALIEKKCLTRSDIVFYTRGDNQYQLGGFLLTKSGFNYKVFSKNELISNSLSEINILKSSSADLIFMDRLETSKELVTKIISKGKKIITFDDYGDGRLSANLSICAILDDLPQSNNVFKGYEYLILSNSLNTHFKFNNKPNTIVATFGGHDARDLCQHFLNNISELPNSLEVDIILGRLSIPKINNYLKQIISLGMQERICIHNTPSNYYDIISKADVAVCSGGLSIFEFAACGVPSIGLPQYTHQLNTIIKLANDGICLLGSNSMTLSNKKFLSTLNELLLNYELRKDIALTASKKINGNGLMKVINLLVEKFPENLKSEH